MERTVFLLLLALFAAGCGNAPDNKEQEKKLFNEVMEIHNEVMNYESIIMENKTKLDSFARVSTVPTVKDSAALLSKGLENADVAMGEWMHKFEPDYSKKAHDEAMKYLAGQKVKITEVDSITKKAIKASWQFLSNHK
ncbi:hypothetical protein LJ707_04000 [Mucilaginibacter sp. UR6-1]|uniref:hypothetical protein n=1 Tax=Mucilaginibacter sp. UR6-1 TaxID=1435643 RepID=UPI001E2D9DA6|nr:hypothetical protein [Mucilaginibacter sp. UR6-1]MCC8408079.1 hypothetical protein [Mucilaginibacter sp. UR6-1]